MLWYRRQQPALTGGDYEPIETKTTDCFAYAREAARERRIIALNFAAEAQRVMIAAEGHGRIVLSTHLDREEIVPLSAVTLRPYEGVIIEQVSHG